jgi:hypothetical protein
MNSVASQSSSSGCVGFAPIRPKSFSVSTMPVPKYRCQIRFTVTRASSGLAGSTSHRARSNRFFFSAFGAACSALNTSARTGAPRR